MKIHHVKRSWSRPFFMSFKKHYCPVCGEALQKIKVSKIVNSKSEEAKNFDFSSSCGDGFMAGDVKFIWTEFNCSKCNRNYSINEIHKIEKLSKKSGK